MNKIFHYKERNSSILKEVLGGIIVFFAMIYILPVNASILSDCGGNYQAVFIATALCSGICCMLMGLFANYPIVISAGMGMSAYLAYTVCGSFGYSFEQALLLVFISGLLFLILTLTSLREKIIQAIPPSLKYAVSAGLGGFICFVGLKNGGIIEKSSSTFVQLGDFSNPTVLLSLFGIVLALVLMQIKGKIGKLSIIIAMIVTALFGLLLNALGIENMPKFTKTNTLENFSSFIDNVGLCFHKDAWAIFAKPETYAILFSLIFVQIFDTTATLIAVGKKVGIMYEKGQLIGVRKAMLADSFGSIFCGPIGTSTLTSFAESTIGVESGARTGLSACVTGLLFLLSPFLYPLFSIFSGVANGLTPVTSLALVSVGCLMFSNLKNIDWNDTIIIITSFLMILLMILCYSISDGLGLSIILYCLMMLFAKRGKEVPIMLYGIGAFFILGYILKIIV